MARLPFVAATSAIILAHVLGSAVSVLPPASWWGSYIRQQGTVTLLCYAVLFFAVLMHFRRIEQWQRMAFAISLTSVPISAHAVAEQLGVDPFGLGRFGARSIGTLGNPIFLGAYLIFPVFISLERILSPRQGRLARAVHASILLLQLAAVATTQSRGPIAGLLTGIFFFTFAGLILRRRHGVAEPPATPPRRRVRRWGWLAPPLAAGLLVSLLLVVSSPLARVEAVRRVPYLGRVSGMLDIDSGTAQVRILIWEGIGDLLYDPAHRLPAPEVDRLAALRLPFGYGPETLAQVFARFYPPELGPRHGWNAIPDRAHNETLDMLVGTGVFGLVSFVALFVSVFWHSSSWLMGRGSKLAGPLGSRSGEDVRRTSSRSPSWAGSRSPGLCASLLLGVAAGFAVPLAVTGSVQLTAVGMPLGLVTGLFLWMLREGFRDPASNPAVPHATLVLALFAAMLAHFVDIEVGIAVTPTRAYFWVLLGVLGAVVSGRLAGPGEGVSSSLSAAGEPWRPANREAEPEARGGGTPRRESGGDSAPEAAIYGVLCGLAVTALTFDLFTFSMGSGETVTGLLGALAWGRVGGPPGPAWILALTVAAAALLLLSREREPPAGRAWGDFVVPGLIAPAAFVLVHAIRLERATRLGEESSFEPLVRYLSSFFSAYHIVAMGLLIAAGVLIASAGGGAERGGRRAFARSAVRVAAVIVVVWIAAAPGIANVRADILFHQAKALAAAKRWPAAMRSYDLAIERRPMEDSYYYGRGTAYFEWARATPSRAAREARFERALQSLTRAAELNPLDPSHPANLARLLTAWGSSIADPRRRRSKWIEARAFYDRALSLHPRSPDLAAERDRIDGLLAEEGARSG